MKTVLPDPAKKRQRYELEHRDRSAGLRPGMSQFLKRAGPEFGAPRKSIKNGASCGAPLVFRTW
jgi:hypothetical protein